MANILITGVTSGIGHALALEFARLGHYIIGCGKNPEKLTKLKAELPAKSHIINIVDVSKAAEVQEWANSVYFNYSQIDIIINNAGTKSELLPLWEVTAADFEQVINTNVIGVANIIRSFVPNMVKLNHGIIVNISSDWGRVGEALVASYCASKFAVEGLTQSFAKELPSEMISIALSPFIVYTELLEKCRELLLPNEYKLGVTPEEWAKYVVPRILKLKREDNGKSFTWSPKNVG